MKLLNGFAEAVLFVVELNADPLPEAVPFVPLLLPEAVPLGEF